MNHMESQDASNDDTTIISELLKSAEAMQSSSVATASISGSNMQLQQINERPTISNSSHLSATLLGDASKQNLNPILNSAQYSDVEDIRKMHQRHVHIPYILNGELYQIQTQDGENVTVKCCHCPPDRVYRGSVRSTGNFHMHIKRRHPDLLGKLHDMKVNALLERRDRLMRNRKISHRSNRNRSTNSIVPSNDNISSFKNEDEPNLLPAVSGTQSTLESTSELSLMHTHKLKIKTVFQRHQMQQREAAELRNYVVMPIGGKLPTNESEQPINYSLRSVEIHPVLSSSFLNANPQAQAQSQIEQRILPSDNTNHTTLNNYATNVNGELSSNLSANNVTEQNAYNSEKHTNNRSLSTSSLSCPSVVSSYSSNHQYDMEINRAFNSFPFQHHNLSIIKPEHLLLGPDSQAIDLTMQTDSGIFSNSEDSISVQNSSSQNNTNDSNNNQRADALKANSTNDETNFSNNNTNGSKWQELLMHVENSLRDIQREMNVRNQIESNRMFLDIAKFKFLNPGFQFNW